MEWSYNGYMLGKTANHKLTDKLGAFDLDSTLICTKSGKKFATDKKDWKFYSDNVVNKLKNLVDTGYCIVIITNQAGLNNNNKINEWKNKIEEIVKTVKLPIAIYASITHDVYRKPFPTFIKTIFENTNIKLHDSSFYCGDACGRENDFSDTDYKFALNCNLKFITPNELFDNEAVVIPKINYSPFDEIKKLNKIYTFKSKIKEMILMVAAPGSGKSTFVSEYIEPRGYVRINRDTIGSITKCLKLTRETMESGKNVVIDNTNNDLETRSKYIKIAKNFGYSVRCLIIDVSIELAKHNSAYRYYKNASIYIPEIAYRIYKKNYVEPSIKEGISEIERVKPFISNYENDYITLFLH